MFVGTKEECEQKQEETDDEGQRTSEDQGNEECHKENMNPSNKKTRKRKQITVNRQVNSIAAIAISYLILKTKLRTLLLITKLSYIGIPVIDYVTMLAA